MKKISILNFALYTFLCESKAHVYLAYKIAAYIQDGFILVCIEKNVDETLAGDLLYLAIEPDKRLANLNDDCCQFIIYGLTLRCHFLRIPIEGRKIVLQQSLLQNAFCYSRRCEFCSSLNGVKKIVVRHLNGMNQRIEVDEYRAGVCVVIHNKSFPRILYRAFNII